MKRFARDAGILLAFCGAFYLLTVLVGRLDGESTTDSTDFSPARKRADVHLKRKNWESASEQFKILTEQDPLDGNAWYNYASCFFQTRRSAMHELHELRRAPDPDPTAIQVAEQAISDNSEKAHQLLLKAKEFARYRGNALLRLAVIDSYRGQYDESMDFLQAYIEDENLTQFGLSRYREFGAGGPAMASPGTPPMDDARLHAKPRFWKLVQEERVHRLSF